MIIGVPSEIKASEYRVGIVPAGVHALVEAGHSVTIQAGAGLGTGISDVDYASAGARLVKQPSEIFEVADLIVKVKEPLPDEWPLIRVGQIIFTYFHFAA